ncbi:winged helix-turn-helix domain-containing protein [Marinimicrobium alkaliphilum]|uniref:winged helix-turn-helix domain-containing protein n=1 Tax=Marinimicrobium alkaliphilum TaxID=2202654 RepID=UPI001E55F91A|nr:transcriptional regulator [Marinimicrobium alkaliphilum]
MSEFDHNQLDDLIHSRIRLAVMAVLAGLDSADFTFIRDRVKTTDGNLSTHLRKLEDNGYIDVEKRFEGRKPVTEIALSAKGREAFAQYLNRLESMLGNGAHSS